MAAGFEVPPRGYYRTYRSAVEALKDGGISAGAFALFNVLAYYGWRDGHIHGTLTDWAVTLRVTLSTLHLWLAELERAGLVERQGEKWLLVDAMRSRRERPPADALAGGDQRVREETPEDTRPLCAKC